MESSGGEEPVSYFIMPGSAIKSLKAELEITNGEEAAKEAMHRYGLKCGAEMVKIMGFESMTIDNFDQVLDSLLRQVGMGRSIITRPEESELNVTIAMSMEAAETGKREQPTCDFTAGYLEGMISKALGEDYKATEVECVSTGKKMCIFRLSQGAAASLKAEDEAQATTEPKYQLEDGWGYLINEEEFRDAGYDVFLDKVTHGYKGMCVTREFPDKLRKKYGLEKTPILWLSSADKDYAIPPGKLSEIYHKLNTFMSGGEKSVILISGVEYLITQNNYLSVLKFLQLLNEQIAISDSILIVPVTPEAMSSQDFKNLERELTPLELG